MDKVILLERKSLSLNNRYNQCPYCLKSALDNGQDSTTVPPLQYQKWLEIWKTPDGETKETIEKNYKCIRCGRTLTVEDFVNTYSVRYDGTKWTDKPKENRGESYGQTVAE